MKEISRVDTLIITVGTRQVGWRCKDGVVRCFGADGGRDHPPHIQELYEELGIERGYYQEGDRSYLWSVRDLGKRYYEHCVDWLGEDFEAVELLLDHQIIEDGVQGGLKHIILWGTDQPETVSYFFRRADTLWLAKLMEGKIKLTWSTVTVDVLHPVVAANDNDGIRQELEEFILRYALECLAQTDDNQFVLMIENKGSVPDVAEGLAICAAALVKQYQVVKAIPIDPELLYVKLQFGQSASSNIYQANRSQNYRIISLGEYFWPLERLRVISAWKRGDFQEAQMWLKPHQNCYRTLYQLAGYLALSTNWEILKFLNDRNIENGWLRSNALTSIAKTEQINSWKSQLLYLRKNDLAQAWEACFLIELLLIRENYTSAFIQFAQTLERLLYIRSREENWVNRGLIIPPEHLSYRGNGYEPNFNDLINGWCQLQGMKRADKWYQLLDTIRNKRNKIIHQAEPLTLTQLQYIWANNGFPVKWTADTEEIRRLMMDVLRKVCDCSWSIPEKTLLRSLYEWGLDVLSTD